MQGRKLLIDVKKVCRTKIKLEKKCDAKILKSHKKYSLLDTI